MVKPSKVGELRKIPFFSGLSDYDLHQIDKITRKKSYRAGDVIIRENSRADKFHIIHNGKIEISKRFEDGEQVVLAVHSDGDFFGEMAILDEGPRSATARALESTVLWEVSREDFENLLHTAPRIAYDIMKELSTRLRETGALMVSHLQRKNRQLSQAYLDTVTAVVNTIEARDAYTRGHTDRVTFISKEISKEMGLEDEDLFVLEIGALLHDVGKIGVPDAVLLKPGPLEKAEYELIKRHPEKGRRMMSGISYLEQAIPCVLYHHERFDGRGYPEGLSGTGIPLAGRIIAVADAFDAMTSDRPYRQSLSREAAMEEIRAGAGGQFDPDVVKAFLRVWEAGRLNRLLREKGK